MSSTSLCSPEKSICGGCDFARTSDDPTSSAGHVAPCRNSAPARGGAAGQGQVHTQHWVITPGASPLRRPLPASEGQISPWVWKVTLVHQWDVWVPHRDVFSPQRMSETVTCPFLGISDSAVGERVTGGQAG